MDKGLRALVNLGGAAIFSAGLASAYASTSYASDFAKRGVLDTVYMMIMDDSSERRCINVKSDLAGEYEMCGVKKESNIDGRRFRFTALAKKTPWFFAGKYVYSLKILVNHDLNDPDDCSYILNYVPEEDGHFNDSKVFLTPSHPLKKTANGGFDGKIDERCWKNFFKDSEMLDMKKARRIHEKTIEDIAVAIGFSRKMQPPQFLAGP